MRASSACARCRFRSSSRCSRASCSSLLASYSFTGAVPLYFVGTLVEKTITMELAPVLTGLALAGRVGANIAAELGTMRVTEQIDALETLAYDPYAYLVVPRVLAGTVMFPVVVGLSMVVGVAAGWVASVLLLGTVVRGVPEGTAALLRHVRRAIRPREGSVLRHRRHLDRLHAGAGRPRRRAGRGAGRHQCCRLLGGDDPRAGCLLGRGLAPGEQTVKKANDFAVGLTILAGTAIIIAATLWVKQAEIGRDRATVSARFRDVGGVRVGTPVVIRGVRAGRIEAMELSDSIFVVAKMTLDPAAELPMDPVVLLNESSLFGEWQATITSRDAVGRDADVLRQLSETARDDGVLPGATLPDIARLTAVAGRIAGDVATVAERVQVAFDDQAARELRSSVRSISELSTILAQTVREQSNNLTTVSSDVRGGVQSLVKSAELLRDVAERVDSSTARGEVRQIVADAGEAARQLRETGRRLAVISEQLARSQVRLESFLATSDSIARKIHSGSGSLGLLINDPTLYRNADSALRQLNLLLADVQKNPRKYVNLRIF